ncbi:MAG TPA: DUF397 domain-containing protein [Candidatus Saccharimonadia bacterium]|nr:DUF397 domain-containing protein [Candidatus Saccharimonadia bacterium]
MEAQTVEPIRDNDGLRWRKSTYSGTTECVEVAKAAGGVVLVRDSKDPQGPALGFNGPEWAAFLAGVRGGEFDA